MKYANIREEEVKNKVGQDFFGDFDTTKILGNIDFCVTPKNKNPKQTKLFDDINLLWAEAKTGDYDVISMFAQLILTIGKARTFDKTLPPAFLGAFDGKKIAFIPYNAVLDIFSLNDFNWNVTSSNQNTKEFSIIRERVQKSLDKNDYLYDFLKDEKELKFFIKNNLAKATESGKILINKNNFVPIYLRWVEQVKPYIDFNWEDGKKQNILDNSFFLADLFNVEKFGAKQGDLIFLMSGNANKVRTQLSALRMELGNRLGLRKGDEFAPLWVVDFPLLEWDEETGRYHAMHHPFTSPKPEDVHLLETEPGKARANAYDMVLNGNEIGGGSVRIFNKELQSKMFDLLGFSKEEAEAQFGFLMNAFKFGAPPHAGLAFGFDRLVAILDGNEVIRDYIAFPKNNSGRDVMIDAPSPIHDEQLNELALKVNL